MPIRVLDPTHETVPAGAQRAPRPASFKGATIGFISNGKEGTAGFFDHLETLLRQEFEVDDVVLRVKSNYSAPADAAIMAEARGWDAVIAGIGD